LYTIRESDNVIIGTYPNSSISQIYTIEEFLETFPYKVGDKVQRKRATSCGTAYEIEQIKWEDNQVKYIICDLYWKNCKCTVTSEDLQPYKEETMEKEISGAIVDRFICLEGYDFYDDKGNIIETKEITMKKKQPKYPKTYEECCEVLGYEPDRQTVTGYDAELIENLQTLKLCRDAYWKIEGDWKPDWSDYENIKYIVGGYDGGTGKDQNHHIHKILAFPTAEMRDAFYENFKELIEECKELL
jgi:hypothetical protein